MGRIALLVVALGLAQFASADVIWSDNFDSYADQAAMDAVYTQVYPTYPAMLEQTKGYSDLQSVHFGQPTANSQVRMYKNLGLEAVGTDEMPLKIEFQVDIDTIVWNTRQYIEIRGYAGAGYADGGLEELIAMGFTSSGIDTTKYNGRVLLGPEAGWFSHAADRVTDWAKMTALIKTNTIEFYINDQLDTTKLRAPGYTFDCIVIGSGLSSAGADVWFDDLVVEVVPEPATLALLGLGGLALIRRRR